MGETKNQIARLEEIFSILNLQPNDKKCEAMEGILEEANKVMKEWPNESPVKDAALISCAQRVEHYEIAVYGTLRTFAKHFKLNDIADLLQETFQNINIDCRRRLLLKRHQHRSRTNDDGTLWRHPS